MPGVHDCWMAANKPGHDEARVQSQFGRSASYGILFGKPAAAGLSSMTRSRSLPATLAAISVLLLTGPAPAQQRGSGNFLDDLFNRGEPQRQQAPSGRTTDPGDLSVRLDRMESALRPLSGTIERLQYRNQQVEMQLKRMQDDTEYRLQQLGSRGGAVPPAQAAPMGAPLGPGNAPAAAPGRRSDVFDPAQQPNAPGAPRTLGNEAVIAGPGRIQDSGAPVGAPGRTGAGAPLDLSTLAGNDPAPSRT